MSNFIRQLMQICLFKLGPQDLPANKTLLLICAFAATISYILTDTIHSTIGETIPFATAQMTAFAIVIWLLLKFKGFEQRWQQTMTALFGTAALLQFIGWPFAILLKRSQMTDQIVDLGANQGAAWGADWAVFILLALGLWFLLVMVRIIRHAVEVTTGLSIMLAFASQSLIVLVLRVLFGPLPGI